MSNHSINEKELTVGYNLPLLVFSFLPFPHNNVGAVMNSTWIFVSMKRINIQVNIIHHSTFNICQKVVGRRRNFVSAVVGRPWFTVQSPSTLPSEVHRVWRCCLMKPVRLKMKSNKARPSGDAIWSPSRLWWLTVEYLCGWVVVGDYWR